jgi:Mrp family chromosome partitioning ATPase
MFCGAALVFGLVLPVAIDILDPRIHGLRDMEGVLGFQPISWVMEKREAGPEFAREQILRLANRFSQEQQNHGSRIFAFTSVKARGGTSTLVTETARALSRLGVPALAVEANAYRADPRYRKPNARGLTVLLAGHQELRESVVTAEAELPDRIPVGEIGGEKNLPDIQNLIEVLRQAATMYEVVLVDLPPILVSVDAEYIARVADVAVLVIEAEVVTRGELRRAAASLERLKVSAVSAVLNRVRAEAGNGFARAALLEFQTGSTEPPPKWSQPWLWT